MGDESHGDPYCRYCYCPCNEYGSFLKRYLQRYSKRYFKYLILLLIVLVLVFYPFGDPNKVGCGTDSKLPKTFVRNMNSIYQYVSQLSLPELPKIPSMCPPECYSSADPASKGGSPTNSATTRCRVEIASPPKGQAPKGVTLQVAPKAKPDSCQPKNQATAPKTPSSSSPAVSECSANCFQPHCHSPTGCVKDLGFKKSK